jgi:uncharacterized membrane protein YfcA
MTHPPRPADACLERTRSAVLNVMVVAGIGIALSGFLLRWRDRWALTRAPEPVRIGLIAGLVGLAVASHVVRRTVAGRRALRDPVRRETRFYYGHVVSAILGALAVPLGLAYGWFIQPRFDPVGMFWIVATTLGLLALPRSYELEGLDDPDPNPDSHPAPGPNTPHP